MRGEGGDIEPETDKKKYQEQDEIGPWEQRGEGRKTDEEECQYGEGDGHTI